MYWIGIGTEVAVHKSQVVPISQVVLKTGFIVGTHHALSTEPHNDARKMYVLLL